MSVTIQIDWPPRNDPLQPVEAIQHLFPTSLWTYVFPRAEIVNPHLTRIILEAAHTYPSQGKSNVGGWRSLNDLFHGPVPEVKELGSWIMDCVRQVIDGSVSTDRFRGTLSAVGWASVCRMGSYNAPHIHPESAWSGV